MNESNKNKHVKALSVTIGLLITPVANAHLMVAQHGTLNFLNDDVYMAISLPAAAFGDADEDNDGLLSVSEFSAHKPAIIESINEQVKLSTKKNELAIEGLLISPVAPHDDPKGAAAQLIIMGRFVLNCSDCSDSELTFQSNLFGTTSESQVIKMTANRKSSNDKQVFEVTPKVNKMKLEFN